MIFRKDYHIKRVTPGVNKKSLEYRTHVNPQRKFVLYRIPKAANSTVLRTILEHDVYNAENYIDNYDSRFAKKNAYYRVRDLNIMQKLSLRYYYHFAVVRNPFVRILSTYLDKIVGNKKKNIVLNKAKLSNNEEISFNFFLNYVMNGGLFDNPHWAPQTSFIPCNPNLNIIGKVENIEEDMKKIIKNIFPEEKYKGIKNWNKHKSESRLLIDKYYGKKEIEIVKDIYDCDFNYFNYSKNIENCNIE